MNARRRTLGAHLAWLVTLSTAAGLFVFTAAASFVVWLDERDEDDVLEEVFEDIGPAVVVATPLGVLVALLGARWAARRVTARIDALVAAASRMTAEDLDERLPASGRGDELDDLVGALNGLFERIDDGIAALRHFAAAASHELRTPLTVMINSLEVARRRPRDVETWERVSGELLDELHRMAELIEALLQSARSGAFDLAAAPIELDAELAARAPRWREAATSAQVSLRLEVASGAAVRIDPRGFEIAVGNLINNAIAHSPPGGSVTVRTACHEQQALIHVEDEGPGVAAADRDRIFSPFVRGAGAVEAPTASLGLGLSIARRIVEANAGTIHVGEAARGGARFTIALPAVSDAT